jgi:long-chain acyl-CoA synthetase
MEAMLLQTSIRHIITTQSDDYINFVGKVKNWLSPKKWVEQWQADSTVIRYIRLRQILKQKLSSSISWPTIQPNDLALIQYTSGTTDQPKGVSLSHLNLSANYQQIRHMMGNQLEAGKVGLCPIPLQHIVGLNFTMSLLSAGAHVILSSMPELLQKPKNFQNMNIDILAGIPFLYDQLIKKAPIDAWLNHVTLFISGGGFTSRDLQQKWFKATGNYLCEAYGMSETSPLVSINPPQRIRLGSVGVVLPNTEVCIVDKNQKMLGFNQPGELWHSIDKKNCHCVTVISVPSMIWHRTSCLATFSRSTLMLLRFFAVSFAKKSSKT